MGCSNFQRRLASKILSPALSKSSKPRSQTTPSLRPPASRPLSHLLYTGPGHAALADLPSRVLPTLPDPIDPTWEGVAAAVATLSEALPPPSLPLNTSSTEYVAHPLAPPPPPPPRPRGVASPEREQSSLGVSCPMRDAVMMADRSESDRSETPSLSIPPTLPRLVQVVARAVLRTRSPRWLWLCCSCWCWWCCCGWW